MMTPTTASARALRPVDRGEAGRVLADLRAQDFVFTVLETERVSDTYQRVRCAGNGFLRTHAPYPTMWVRLWFTDPTGTGAGHQRAYTLVDPNVEADTFWLEFAIHDGAAARWAQQTVPGDEIEASLYGSEPSLPDCDDVDRHLLVGDTASLPAINSLLDAVSAAPTTVVLEWVHPEDRALPVRLRAQDSLRWVRRTDNGQGLLDAVDAEIAAFVAADGAPGERTNLHAPEATCTRLFAWGACDTVTTRALTKKLRAAGLRRDCIKTLGYWLPPKEADQALAG
jgi:NADPH-dependent ferric siderophore reductase